MTDSALTADYNHIIFDTAPTGHTLLLLDAAGAYHREVIKQRDSSIVHYATPMMQLQNPKQTKILLVTLAETTPVLEAASLQADLRRAGIEPWTWIPNNSMLQRRSIHPYCASALVTSLQKSNQFPLFTYNAMPLYLYLKKSRSASQDYWN